MSVRGRMVTHTHTHTSAQVLEKEQCAALLVKFMAWFFAADIL